MLRIFLSALLAGAVIAIGGTVCLSLESAVAGALFFTVGLFAVCTRSLHLFTGKVCYVFENDRAYARTLHARRPSAPSSFPSRSSARFCSPFSAM